MWTLKGSMRVRKTYSANAFTKWTVKVSYESPWQPGHVCLISIGSVRPTPPQLQKCLADRYHIMILLELLWGPGTKVSEVRSELPGSRHFSQLLATFQHHHTNHCMCNPITNMYGWTTTIHLNHIVIGAIKGSLTSFLLFCTVLWGLLIILARFFT